MQTHPEDPLIGVSIGGRYAIQRCIAEGRTARIYEGTQLLGKRVIIKVQYAEQARVPATRHRFMKEARILGRLRHESVVNVCDFIVLDEPFSTHAIVMDPVEGRTLEALLCEGPLPPQRASEIAADIALCLHAAHQIGIAHGGLRVSEVMVVERGVEQGKVKVLDWGDAQDACEGLELAAASAADQRALGRLLQKILTGGVPPPDVSQETGRTIPVWLQALIARTTSPRPEGQFPSLEAMAGALRHGDRPGGPGREVLLRFCPRCGGQSIDTTGYGSPWTGVCNRCGAAFTMLMMPLGNDAQGT